MYLATDVNVAPKDKTGSGVYPGGVGVWRTDRGTMHSETERKMIVQMNTAEFSGAEERQSFGKQDVFGQDGHGGNVS